MLRPYDLAFGSLLLLVSPYFLLRGLISGKYLPSLFRRLGKYDHSQAFTTPCLWLHAVSVGEVGVALTWLEGWLERHPGERVVLTTTTLAGQELARRRTPAGIAVDFFPFDLSFAIRRFLRCYPVRALVLTEKELWPNLLFHLQRAGIPVAILNGHFSDRSFRRYQRLGAIGRSILERVGVFAVQSDLDRERLTSLGVPASRVAVTGNVKFDGGQTGADANLAASLLALAGGRLILIAGSTLAAEEEQVLDAVAALRTPPFLVLAPRHPERFGTAGELLRRRGIAFLRRSTLVSHGIPEPPPAVLLLDSIGELAGLYALADIAFVGGSLVPAGGHNILEPARFARPIVVGPYTGNFRDVVALFRAGDGIAEVADAATLAETLDRLLADPAARIALGERGRAVLSASRGARDRSLAAIEAVVNPARSSAATGLA